MEKLFIDCADKTPEVLDPDEELDGERDKINTPFDPKQVDINTRKFTISSLLERLKHSELELNPDFQRRANLWDAERKSRLIESVLLRIPLPSFYFREDEEGNFSVVDGLQRLCSIFHFIDYSEINKATGAMLNPLRLERLQYLKDLENKNFEELDRSFKRRINELEIEANVIRSTTPKEVMFNVFARLNQGGLPLSAQEIRNAIYPGEWRKHIRSLSESNKFLEATGGRIPTDRQQDMEMVLRFIALWALNAPFQRQASQILDKFLNDTVELRLVAWSAENWSSASESFFRGLTAATEIFGKHAFRKSSGNEARTHVNKGVFESQLITLSSLTPSDLNLLTVRRDLVCKRFGELISDNNSRLSKALRSGTGHAESSNARIEELTYLFKEIIHA